jgi:outer membrane protein assembly factor BamB
MPESVYIGSLVVAGPSVVVELRDAAGAALRSFHVSDGTEAWKVAIAGSESTELGALSIAASDGGAVVVAAHLAGGKTVSLGTEALTGKGVNNLLWALFDGDGGVVRSQIVPVDGTIYPSAVATDAGGDVWVLGSFSGSVDFGDGLHTAHPSPPPTTALDPFGYDVFLARYH